MSYAWDSPLGNEACQRGPYMSQAEARCNLSYGERVHHDDTVSDFHTFVRPICTCSIGTSAGRECCPRHYNIGARAMNADGNGVAVQSRQEK